jgi:hypothetical protein
MIWSIAAITYRAAGNVHKTRDIALQIQQSVQLDGGFGRAMCCPAKQAQAQLQRGRVQGEDPCALQIHAQRLIGIQRQCQINQHSPKIRIQLPRPCGVGVSQGIAGNASAAKTHAVQITASRSQVDLDITQGLASAQLGKGHGVELVAT